MTETPPPDGDGEAAAAEPVAPPTRHGAPVTWSRGQEVLHPTREQYVDVVRALRDDDGFEMCVDVTAVDYLTGAARELPPGLPPERFEVVVNLLSMADGQRVRVRVQVPEAEASVPSLYDLYPGAEAMEREVYDMFGIVFDGHPDPSRILMPEDWEGHPLRKDFAVGKIPVQFKAARSTR